jgi:hypothetical protein
MYNQYVTDVQKLGQLKVKEYPAAADFTQHSYRIQRGFIRFVKCTNWRPDPCVRQHIGLSYHATGFSEL